MWQKILSWLFKELVDGRKLTVNGLLEHLPDLRDYKYSMLGDCSDYQPMHDRLELPILEIKNQTPNNTCVWHSYASCRENDEGVTLSPRSIVLYAKQRGYIKADGLTSIRLAQQAGREFGIASESLVPNPNYDWTDYSGLPLTDSIRADASKHKAQSYFWVEGRDEWIKALDEGHPIHVGFDWYSTYNMSGGFSAPWILPWRRGWKVGGHGVKCMGYDSKQGLLIFQNSFGEDWGDKGKFYIRMEDVFREGTQGAVTVDLSGANLTTFCQSYEGKDIKTDGDPGIFRVEDGKRRPFTDENTFYAWGGRFLITGGTYDLVSQSFMDSLPLGEPMKAEDSPNWPKLSADWDNIRWMRHPDNLDAITTLLMK